MGFPRKVLPTHCCNGHAYSIENTIWERSYNKDSPPDLMRRKCRECHRAKDRRMHRHRHDANPRSFTAKLYRLTRDEELRSIALLWYMEGRVCSNTLRKTLPEMQRAVNRDLKHSIHQWGMLSLDAPIPGTTIARIDTLTEGPWS